MLAAIRSICSPVISKLVGDPRGQFRSQRFTQRRVREQRDIDDVEIDRVHMVPRIGQQIERAA